MMHSQRHTVLCIQILWLVCWPLFSEAAKFRCGTDLLSDLLFVCGDRGIYFGRGTWSGYGARPRGKGIVDQCCRPGGCELHHLEKYCAKPKSLLATTAPPTTTTTAAPSTTTTAPPTTTTAPSTTTTAPPITTTAPSTTTTAPSTTTTAPLTTTTAPLTTVSPITTTAAQTTTQPDMVQQFEAVFHKRLLEHLGAPDSPKREAYRKKTQPSPRRRGKVSSPNRRRQESASGRSLSASGRATR
ncbi:integumentary mucin C.1-like [Solea solea]|uniref:integumentary mucin C.1-like n=1 Tax=Solea solea TaxID=90069 RepID=UPI00272AFF05|nr:integumentary mucin C.1-like [Solea solea]